MLSKESRTGDILIADSKSAAEPSNVNSTICTRNRHVSKGTDMSTQKYSLVPQPWSFRKERKVHAGGKSSLTSSTRNTHYLGTEE